MKKQFLRVSRGEERLAFLYVVISAIAIACVMTYAGIAGLYWWQTALLLTGGLLGAWATLFSFLEVRRLGQTPNERQTKALAEDPYLSREVVVAPSTGEPCPHHEDYPESAGLDQGQLTSSLPGGTPLIESLLSRRTRQPASGR